MAKPFRIQRDSIARQPLSVRETAKKYGVSTDEFEKVNLFVGKWRASFPEVQPLKARPPAKSKRPSSNRKVSRGQK